MAVNLLPILLVGGAAAVVVSAQKKEKGREKCPAHISVSFGEWKGIYERAHEKFGQNPDPGPEANFILNEALPRACSRASINSSVKLTIPDADTEIVMPIPDLYILIFDQAAARRLVGGVATKEQLDGYVNRELDWYKDTTGRNFNPNTEHFKKMVAAMVKLLEKLTDDLTGGLIRPCPKEVDMHVDKGNAIEGAMVSLMEAGNTDPFKMADQIFAVFFPDCSKADYNSSLRVLENIPGDPSPQIKVTVDFSTLYGSMVLSFARGLLKINKIGQPKFDVIDAKVRSDFKKLTGRDFVDPGFD